MQHSPALYYYSRVLATLRLRFTGIDDPYESPTNPEIVLDEVHTSPQMNAERILADLIARNFVQDFC